MTNIEEYNEFDRRVRELEDGISRLVLSANLSYDSDLHMEITRAYTTLYRDLHSSGLNEEYKNHFRILINELLREAEIDVDIMLKNISISIDNQ
ncbi:hypothetical protein ACWN8V_06880 [Vagococcus elongatus]|uniref:Uncharacterized protein n=1 Tax=Vagococcus elongatus TaxID=180344 RepID=A0A430AW32_9ENTE|nr:hypothetical protein [Vagococcus elongatus]RSU12258.1 hypothetical protein CBF29_06570 [Vagococcus elongatus]